MSIIAQRVNADRALDLAHVLGAGKRVHPVDIHRAGRKGAHLPRGAYDGAKQQLPPAVINRELVRNFKRV